MRSIASVVLVLCLLSTSTPAAPQTIIAVTKETSISLAFWYHSSGLAKFIQGQGVGNAKRQEKQSDRDAKVSRLQIFPGDATIDVSDRVRFSAVAYDSSGEDIGGVKVKWSAQSSESKRRIRISQRGELEALTPGTFTVTAQAGMTSAQVIVVVRSSPRKNLSEKPLNIREVSTRDTPPTGIGANETKKATAVRNTSRNQPTTKREVAMVKKAHAAKTTTVAVEAMPVLPGDGWDGTNYWSADDPGNGVGNPPGRPLDGGAGSGNFQFAAPVLNLPGRGINISLGLVYNSRLWNKAASDISYDNDRGWPAPGFNLGFGKMLGMGVYNGAMLVDADGTRHSYSGNITFYNWGTYGVMHTTDGSFIDYTYWTGTGGGMTWGQARLPNGTVINFGASSGHLYPTSIEDANGNYISITYVNNTGPRIQTVTDTLNRTVNFYYDYNNLLTAVAAPGYNGGGARTLVRLHYHQLTLNYGFSGLTPHVSNSYPWVVDAIYYSATGTGYWLNDSDSYSSYGMLAKIKEERSMGFSASSLNDMGSVWEGSVTRTESYAYPLTPDYSLTDAPTYGSMQESWTRDGTSTTDSATTYYTVDQNSSPRSTTVTLPNGTKSTQYSNNHPGQFDDGLVVSDETRDAANTLLQSSSSTWQQGAYDSPRPVRVTKTDERGQVTAAEFTYGTVYNQVTEVRDYDYGGVTPLRYTRTTYQNSSNYTNNHIFNLPLTVEVYAGDNVTRVSRTDYQYDGQTLTDTPNVVMHDETHNPYAPLYEQCDCYEWDYWQIECLQWNCYWISNYNSATDYRGNVTQITTYADAAGLTGAVSETRRYDITGNLVTASTSCCQQTSFNYTIDTQYAYPQSKTRGSATDPYAQVTTSATYDFNTGLGKSATDANNRMATTDYDANTLRPTISVSPTGAHTDFAYDEAAMTVTKTTYLEAHPTHTTIADQNVKYLNGRGQVRQEKALDAGGVWDKVDTTYDNMGQVSQQTQPYQNGTPPATTVAYDALGRTKTVTAADGSVTETFYNEATRPSVASSTPGETTKVKDAWGRERWGRTDASGRLVEVVEPDPAGSGSVATNGLVTTYTYNTLGNLTQVTQGSQLRNFKYDSLGRLTAQKLAEGSAMLNDAGTYVTTGGLWSDVFTYDDRSNLTSRKDARGVKTVYTYNSDPLNRLQTVSWDTTGFGDTANPILAAAAVTYTYRTKASPSDPTDVTQVASVSTAGVSTESYSFDSEGRVSAKTLTLTSRSSYPFVTDYIYDNLNRVMDVRYPAQYGNGSALRKVVHNNYDIASRLSGLTYDTQSFASNISYNALSQTTFLNVGSGANQINENYSYDSQTGLLSSQTVAKTSTPTNYLLNLSYDYTNASGKRTGQLKKITNNVYGGGSRDRSFSYDALGRLTQVVGGPWVLPSWIQTYSYDRYGNRTGVSVTGSVPRDGLASVSYDVTSNRITNSGFDYDKAGNQVRALIPGSTTTSQRFQYDAANRLVKVKSDDGQTTLATYTYGSSNERLIAEEGTLRTYYVGGGSATIAEYNEIGASTTPAWSKSYVYLGNRLLSTLTPNGSGGESIEYHHPDRLGTRIMSNPQSGGWSEQVTLPFGTALAAESSGTPSNRRFTSYDRSDTTKLDYAVNRHYDPQQGRFTQVDPAGMNATSLLNPQTLNLYAYCTNDPVNRTDPNGLGLIHWIKKHWKMILVIVAVVVAVLLIPGGPALLGSFFQNAGHVILAGAGTAAEGGGISTWIKVVLGGALAAGIAGLGMYLQNRQASGSGGRGKLEGDRKKQYEEEKKKAKDILKKNEQCRKFLSDHGIDPNEVINAINKQRAFDGLTSTISAGAAGIVKPGSSSVGTPVYVAFQDDPDNFAMTAGYAQPGTGATRYDTYFGTNGLNAITIIHEAMHSLTGLDDDELAAKLKLTIPRGSDASEQIHEALKSHGCQ